jgi:hypothetical protein
MFHYYRYSVGKKSNFKVEINDISGPEVNISNISIKKKSMSLTIIENIFIRFQILENAVYNIFTAMITLWAITGSRHFNM